MKALIFIALLAIAHCADNADTPNILIGTWNVTDSTVTSASACCMPIGQMTITNNSNDSIIITATSWAGNECEGFSPSYQALIHNVSGNSSWNELNNGGILYFTDTNNGEVEVTIGFTNGQDIMSMTTNLVTDCNVDYVKQTQNPNPNPNPKGSLALTLGASITAVIVTLLI